MQKCENPACQNSVSKDTEFVLRVPEAPCHHCHSELYAEYFFCSRDCVAAWLAPR